MNCRSIGFLFLQQMPFFSQPFLPCFRALPQSVTDLLDFPLVFLWHKNSLLFHL
jgi:hypothetical protein